MVVSRNLPRKDPRKNDHGRTYTVTVTSHHSPLYLIVQLTLVLLSFTALVARGKKLWNDGDPPFIKSATSTLQNERTPRGGRTGKANMLFGDELITGVAMTAALMKQIEQPESRPITPEQLAAEVKEIYAGLLLVESKNYRYTTHQRSVLPVLVNGRTEYAVPDTGAFRNVMTKEHATSIGAVIDKGRKKQHTFTSAIGQSYRSVGVTELDVSFPDDPGKTSKCEFAVVERCAVPMVFGRAFLEAEEIFTTFSHRLIKAALAVRTIGTSLKKAWRVMLMDAPSHKIGCHVDGELAFAVVDSGSDIDLASSEYAQFQGWDVTAFPGDEGFVMLANEEIVKLAGYTEMCLSIRGRSMMRRFYILDGLVSDIILGDQTLEDFDIFLNYKDSFVKMKGEGEEDFCMIQWVERFNEVEKDVDAILNGQNSSGNQTKKKRSGRSNKTPCEPTGVSQVNEKLWPECD